VKIKQFIVAATIALLAACNNTAKDAAAPGADGNNASIAENPYAPLLVKLEEEKNIQQLITQGWELKDDLEALQGAGGNGLMLPFRSYYLAADGSFTKDVRNDIGLGKWQFDEAGKKITMVDDAGHKAIYKIAALASDELKLAKEGDNNAGILTFVSDAARYKVLVNDPYHIDNNRWRIKPAKAETDSLIKQRLKGFLNFHVLFYRDNIARDKKTISFYGFPTCLKWYAGGIYIIKKEELADNWYGCFYNKAQALKAWDMMNVLLDKKYNWPKGNMSWVKKNLAVLEQMHSKL
jgi:hypothetical protein